MDAYVDEDIAANKKTTNKAWLLFVLVCCQRVEFNLFKTHKYKMQSIISIINKVQGYPCVKVTTKFHQTALFTPFKLES